MAENTELTEKSEPCGFGASGSGVFWVAVTDFESGYHNKKERSYLLYSHYGKLIRAPS